jgi:hypothetical protein
MSARTEADEKIEVIIRGFRRFGRLFVALTLLMGAFLVYEAFDSTVSFRWNGVEVHSIRERLLCLTPLALLAMFGSFFGFAPRSIIERLLRHQFTEVEKMKQRFGLKK